MHSKVGAKPIKKSILGIILLAFLATTTWTLNDILAAPGINKQIAYQGILKTGGVNAADGNYDMVFKIYATSTGGTALWTGTHTAANGNTVAVTSGIFNVMLGSGSGNTMTVDFTDDTLYLGVTVRTDSEMTPRKRIGAAGYAFNADTLDGIDSLTFLRSDTATTTLNSVAYTWPGADGSNGQVLSTNGSAALSWSTVSTNLAGLTDTTVTSPASGNLLIYDGTDSWDNKALSGDIAITSNGTTTIQADSVALTTDTTGNYVASLASGSGIDGGAAGSEGATLTLALGPLTADWNQTGAFDISLNNASSELRILESAGATYYGTLDVGDLSAARTYTFPDTTGTVALTSDLTTTFAALTDTPSSFTNGSLLFTSASAVTQDNANLFWDDTNNRLGIGTTTPGVELDISGDARLLAQGDLRFADADSSNYVAFQSPATVASNILWTLPNADGTSGQVLSTNGSGALSWAAAASGSLAGLTDTTVTSPASGNLLIYDGTDSWDNRALSGDLTVTSAGVAAIQANSVALTTDTTGNYVTSITNGAGIAGGNGGSEGAALTLSLDVNTLTTETVINDSDLIPIFDVSATSTRKITRANFLSGITGALVYQGTWDANSNTPTLADGTGSQGQYHVATSASTTVDLGSGVLNPTVGDWVVHNGTVWEKLDNTNDVQSVFARTGTITAQSGDYTATQITSATTTNIAATNVQSAISELDAEKQPLDAQLTDIAGLTVTDGNFIVGDGTNFVTESGNTARTSLGLGTGDSPTFAGVILTGDITTTGAAVDWDLIDNNASALSFDATGATGILNLITTDSAEGVTVTGAGGLALNPYSTGAGTTGELRFLELAAGGTNYVGFKGSDAITGNVIWTLPNADGTSSQVLSTDGSGALSWATGTVGADSLDFIDFEDILDLDASTEINLGANEFAIDLDSTGDFVIKDGGVAFVTFADDGSTTFSGNLIITNGASTSVIDEGGLAIDTDADGGGSNNPNALVNYNGTSQYVLAHEIKQLSFTITDDGNWDSEAVPVWRVPRDTTIDIVEVHADTMSTSTPTLAFNIEVRGATTVNTAGSDLFSSDQIADADGIDITTLQNNSNVAATSHLVFTTGTSAESGTVDAITVTVWYRMDVN